MHHLPLRIDQMPWFVCLTIAAILGRQNQALLAEIAYLRTELAFIRDQLPAGKPLRFTDPWRKRLARAGARLGWQRLREIAGVAKFGTIRARYRRMRRGTLDRPRRGVGKPQITPEVQKLGLRMAHKNSGWGQHRIAGEFTKLGITVSPRTIAGILDRHGF